MPRTLRDGCRRPKVRPCGPCTDASVSIPPRRDRPPKRCCVACAKAITFRESIRSSTSATGARSNSNYLTGSTISPAIEPPIDLRLGVNGEEYEGIRKDVVHVAGRMTLADALGPFGNPTSDSARSMVTPSTVRALCTVFAPGELPAARIDGILTTTARRVPRLYRRRADLARRHIIRSSVSASRYARRGYRRCRRPRRAPRPGSTETVRRAWRAYDPRPQRRGTAGLRIDRTGDRRIAGRSRRAASVISRSVRWTHRRGRRRSQTAGFGRQRVRGRSRRHRHRGDPRRRSPVRGTRTRSSGPSGQRRKLALPSRPCRRATP